MKDILGLDLGTNSIGWAVVKEAQNDNEQSEIVDVGVRVNPLTTDEKTNFEKGKPISTNADRTLKRSARRNLQRYKLRRKELIELLKEHQLISTDTILTENGKGTTFQTLELRAKSAKEKISLEELARVFLTINKKRGYKSSRKAKNEDEGQLIDGMEIAKRLYEENLTTGQLSLQLLKEGKKSLPDYYRSDLQFELDKVWNFQKQFHSHILTDEFYAQLKGKGQRATSALFLAKYQIYTAENKGSREDKKLQAYQWRVDALSKELTREQLAFVITEINNNLNNSSGYLGAISDRSKELYFNNETVGEYLWKQIAANPHTSLKNQVFYRQDYLDEFEQIWKTQSAFYPEILTESLKKELRDVVIFYQRKLKSQKSLVSFCEFENKEIEIKKEDGTSTKKVIGLKVAPKSSPLFQEFKIWQNLNNVLIRKKGSKTKKAAKNQQAVLFEEEKTISELDLEAKQALFNELNLKGNLKADYCLEILGYSPKEWEMNYSVLEGNRTNKALYEAYLKITDLEGYDAKNHLKVKLNKDEVELDDLKVPASEIKDMVQAIFKEAGINTDILHFNAELDGKDFENQASYQLWHLLYSYEGDDSKSGNELLYKLLETKFGFKKEYAQILANVSLSDDYGSLSTKAMRKIHPYIKENKFSTACELAGYRHSKHSLTKEENDNRVLRDSLEVLKKNSLRQPVVEKILNQMINLVNALLKKYRTENPNFKFDEIRIELARELKKNAEERANMTANINKAKTEHEKIIKILKNEFGLPNPTRNDIIRYRLYEELKANGYKDLYTNIKIPQEKLFTKEIDIEHIIPKSRVFDDSFSNKTLSFRKTNLDKGERTAFDYMESKFGADKLEEYVARVEDLYKNNIISKAKYQKLLKKESEIGDGFVERDLRETQYIAKKAKEILLQITPNVLSTSGGITDRLREDWDLINVMKELNLPKYRALGLTEMEDRKYGQQVEVIIDWTKRNDHRHHAMDALTVAFTKHNHIQYLNYLNARKNEKHKEHSNIMGIQQLETIKVTDKNGNEKRVFKAPMPNFRQVTKAFLENILISHKAKNKVVTKNKNKVAGSNKVQEVLTPRGQLHKETVYGKYQYYVQKEEKIGGKFDLETIKKVANPLYQSLLKKRLEENGGDPKKAFTGKNSLAKNPIYLDDAQTEQLPEKVKLVWLENSFSIRKDITPENFKDEKLIDKILDEGVKRILKERLQSFGNDAKKAFSDLEKNPIWLNKEKGITIKRVTISGVANAEPLHTKKDHLGKEILDKEGKPIPVDFISTGSNHHVAVYRDEKGNLQEKVVSVFEAVVRANQGLPIIDKTYNQHLGWEFLFTMKQNEMFVFPNESTGFNPNDIDLLDPKNKRIISPNLFRVQKLATGDYWFRHHLETTVETKSATKDMTYKRLSLNHIKNIIKVRISHLGDIVSVGEY
ncbi:CRISPR-associated protein cas9/csn1, subtype II/nmemi [Capnocytophaga canimorsus]|uniref:CRISPR-associated endonuclease Cas9 n=1 Tax=Capnocytophaga canimorsus TaxID=28188 RepID=A0A0B7IR20_9FLAO|nr:type II CRISPR RNA-guided endonuclease Cas9 [Capnocytophaga canimorsus]CEN52472.1 CRISPR-associated protein cas9/csn1, subtype II/nmemi [Capnocytophaga canimorsus]